ncbi:MAG: Dipeptide transport system permease protein DppB [Candidatus Heimdallarchaeota archaeon LC_3]|nr:MAG: Dipeptide transport system permease protein DppB [Candidatus Heimdallarchaeota archaeon LC_3]
MTLRGYIVRRSINSVILIFAVIVFNFFLFRLQIFILGVDPVDIALGGAFFENDIREQIRESLGIPTKDANFEVWYNYFLDYVARMITLDFGESFLQRLNVYDLIAQRLPNTVILLGTSSILTIIIGIILGTTAAAKRGTRYDMSFITISLAAYALPVFWIGMLLIMIFGSYLNWFDVAGGTHSVKCQQGLCDPVTDFLDLLNHMTLPVVALILNGFGSYLLLMRNNLVDVLTEDYIVTARAKGLPESTVLYKHAFRNAVLPMVTIIALTFAFIISGAVLTETVFSWPGLGKLILDSLLLQDWPVAEAVFLLIAITVIVANFIADLLYGVLDPRVKYT